MGHPLELINAIFITAILVGLIAMVLADRHSHRSHGFTRRAMVRVLVPLLFGTACWTIQYWLTVLGNASSIHDRVEAVLTYCMAGGFLFAGWSVIRLGNHRLHPELPAARINVSRSRIFAREVFGNVVVMAVVSAGIIAAVVYTILVAPNDTAEKTASGLGLVFLGVGLLDELTKGWREPIGISCGASLILYGGLQIFQDVAPENESLFIYVMAFALAFKMAFLFGMSSFWTMIADWRRAEDAAVEEAQSRFLREAAVHILLHQGLVARLDRIRCNLLDPTRSVESNVNDIDVVMGQARDFLSRHHELPQSLPGVEATIERLAGILQSRYRVAIEISIDAGIKNDQFTDAALGVIAGDALRNVINHAQADNVWITVEKSDDQVRMVIDDDGIGIDLKNLAKGHVGLQCMQHTAIRLGGTFSIKPRKPEGTSVVVCLPINQ